MLAVCLGLSGTVEARKLAFPLLGVEISVPEVFVVDEASPVRVRLSSKNNPVSVSLYRVEFGNLDVWTSSQIKDLEKFILRRLGPMGKVEMVPTQLGGRAATRVQVSGLRAGHPWQMLAAWSFSAGQAQVVEVLFPLSRRNESVSLFTQLCRDVIWISPDRG